MRAQEVCAEQHLGLIGDHLSGRPVVRVGADGAPHVHHRQPRVLYGFCADAHTLERRAPGVDIARADPSGLACPDRRAGSRCDADARRGSGVDDAVTRAAVDQRPHLRAVDLDRDDLA